MNDQGLFDGITRVSRYNIARNPSIPKHLPVKGIEVHSQFGTSFVDTVVEKGLLVPSATNRVAPPAAPNSAVHHVDHYKCFAVKESKGHPKFADRTVEVSDEFYGPVGFEVAEPLELCAPADKNGEGIESPDTWVVCHRRARLEGSCVSSAPVNAGGACANTTDCGGGACKGAEKFEPVFMTDQFAGNQMYLKAESNLCVPAHVTLPAPVP